MEDESRLEEQAISGVVKRTLLNQLDSVKKIAVGVRTNLLKLLQGQADSVSVEGHELVKEDIRIQKLEVETDEVSVDPFSVVLGQIRLNEPIDTHVRVVLTESDLNQALKSKQVIEKFPSLHLVVDQKMVTLELQPPCTIRLLNDCKIRFTGIAKLYESEGARQTAFTSVIHLQTDTRPVLLETFCCSPSQGLSLSFLSAILRKLEEIADQPYLEWEEMALRVKSLEIQNKNLILQIEAQTCQIPSL